jgi:hypothetical protein
VEHLHAPREGKHSKSGVQQTDDCGGKPFRIVDDRIDVRARERYVGQAACETPTDGGWVARCFELQTPEASEGPRGLGYARTIGDALQELDAGSGLRHLGDHPVDVLDDANAVVCVDPRLTSSALARLLENAAAYSPKGGTITVRTDTSLEGLRISVRDRGPGIAPADLPQLFNRFFRGSAAAGTPGTGMGLAIARGLLAAEDGRVWAENHPDGGALFTLSVAGPTRPAGQTEASS